jgi:hypothetical protein
MERNWDTIREILLATEALLPDTTLALTDFDNDHAHTISYHVELLTESNLLHASISRSIGKGPTQFHVYRLTWSGHELLDAIRNESIWNKTKNAILGKGGSMTFDIVTSVAIEFVKKAISIDSI